MATRTESVPPIVDPAGKAPPVRVPRNPRAVVVERKDRPALVVYVFGRYVRMAHWIRNGILIWLILSGIFLGTPFLARFGMGQATESLVMAQVRGWHVAAGWVLLALTLARIYQFLFIRADGRLGIGHELKMGRIMFSWKAWRDQLAFYLLMRRDHPHFTYSNYGPLQFLVYTMLYASLLIISITGILIAAPYTGGGLAAASADLLRPIEVWMGGLANVRIVHRFTMWWFVLFTVAHIYMAVWNSLRTGNLLIEGIISGFKAEDRAVMRAHEGDVEVRPVTAPKSKASTPKKKPRS
jgi:Ni/Fe-hydrogenase 1 B-type cytochrome subunit